MFMCFYSSVFYNLYNLQLFSVYLLYFVFNKVLSESLLSSSFHTILTLLPLFTKHTTLPDAPKSYVIIFPSLGKEHLAVYGCFLVLQLRVSTQKIPLQQTSCILLELIWYEGPEQKVFYLF